MSVDRLVNLERDLRENYPDVADMLLPAVEKARELGVPGRYPRDQRAVGVARDEFVVVRRQFKVEPHTPDLVQRYWEKRWNFLGKRVGMNLQLPDHGYFQDEIDGLEHEMSPRRKLAYAPDEVYKTPEGLIVLSTVHPKMRAWVGKPDNDLLRVTHSSDKGGWFHIESDWQTPFTDTTQKGAEEKLEQLRKESPNYSWKSQRLPTYIVSSEDGYDLNRHHYDEDGWIRLLESLIGGGIMEAYFNEGGRLSFNSHWYPQYQYSDLGVRFEGAKP